MPGRGLQPDVVTFGAAIGACAKSGQAQVALNLITSMDNEGVAPNVLIMNLAINACKLSGRWTDARDLLDSMEGRGLQPDVITLNTVMHVYSRAGQWKLALELLDSFESRGARPNVITLNTAIGEWGLWSASTWRCTHSSLGVFFSVVAFILKELVKRQSNGQRLSSSRASGRRLQSLQVD
jgi:pentatricopeptide repeat protein